LAFDRIGVVVGLTSEARIARRCFALVETGGGTPAGAESAVRRLIGQGARALLSFGLAGGLDPLLRPGTVIVPEAVATRGQRLSTDPKLNEQLGGPTFHTLLAADQIVGSAAQKQHLFVATGCAAVDLESGAVAQEADAFGLPFAVLRAICDPAERDLPPAALCALNDHGAIGLLRVIASVIGQPRQVPALLALGRDAAAARRALVKRTDVLRGLAGGLTA
jgi:adenosylhomocysteine nucleosidase